MTLANSHGIDRRLAIGGGLAAATTLAWPRSQAQRRVIIQRGMAGGGVVQFEAGEAHFSVFASSVALDEGQGDAGADPIFLGSVVWSDPTVDLTLESTRITNYENLNSPEGEGRRIEGLMSGGGEEAVPFTMDVIDFGAPGVGADTISLTVGAGASGEAATPEVDGGDAATPEATGGFSYTAQGTVVSGDVQDVDFGVDLESREVTGADEVG